MEVARLAGPHLVIVDSPINILGLPPIKEILLFQRTQMLLAYQNQVRIVQVICDMVMTRFC